MNTRSIGRTIRNWLLVALLCGASAARAADWYVATNATPASPYDTWQKAFTNVQDALNVAASNDTIYLAGHTFGITNQINWTSSYVTIRGGYAATNAAEQPGPRDSTLWPTVIRRASGTTRIMSISGVTNGTLEGVTITGGSFAGRGGGIDIAACQALVLSDCVISRNSVYVSIHDYTGGGLYVANGDVTLTNCLVSWNTASGLDHRLQGGGIASAGILRLVNTRILNNTVSGRVGFGGSQKGGGVYFSGTALQMKNVLVSGNYSTGNSGDGLELGGGTVNLLNCTVAENGSQGLRRTGGTVVVSNSIVYGHAAADTSGTVTQYDSLVGVNPLFEYGYYLAADSPAVGAGSDTAVNLGLADYARNASGATYGLEDRVNLGWHYPMGFDMTYEDVYVSTNGSDGNTGLTSNAPVRTLTKAIALARDGTRLHVAPGVYLRAQGETVGETFPLSPDGKHGLQFLGAGADETVINALGAGQRVMVLNRSSRTVLSGLTLTRGSVSGLGGGGLYVLCSRHVGLSGCAILTNSTTANGGGQSLGGGLHAAVSEVTVSNCLIKGNSINAFDSTTIKGGGGIWSDGILTVQGSRILNNTATQRYGGGTF